MPATVDGNGHRRLLLPMDVCAGLGERFVKHEPGFVCDDPAFKEMFVPLGLPYRDVGRMSRSEFRNWVDAWQTYNGPGEIYWVNRRVFDNHRIMVPKAVLFHGAYTQADVAGYGPRFLLGKRRYNRLVDVLGEQAHLGIKHSFHVWGRASPTDFERIVGVLAWAMSNCPSSPREVPVFGAHPMWLKRHHRFFKALLGRALPIVGETPCISLRSLDQLQTFSGFRQVAVRVSEIETAVDHLAGFHTILIVTDRSSFEALNGYSGVLAVFSEAGFNPVYETGMLDGKHVFFWGECSVSGFITLARLRQLIPEVRPVLMDRETIEAFLPFAVEDKRHRNCVDTNVLTVEERRCIDMLTTPDAGSWPLKIPQQRISMPYVYTRLDRVLDRQAGH